MRSLSFIIAIVAILSVSAQEIIVSDFSLAERDMSARTSTRVDINGNECAMVKVRLAKDGAQFRGMIAGDISYATSEYRIYMTPGSKKLSVFVPDYLPKDVLFSDYGVGSLEAKTVYILTLETPLGTSHSKQLRQINLQICPNDAYITIDNLQFIPNDGVLHLPLAEGNHKYSLECPGYTSKKGSFNVSSDGQSIELILEETDGTAIGSGYNVMFLRIEADISAWKLKDASASLDYIESQAKDKRPLVMSHTREMRAKLEKKVEEGKPLLISNIKKNKGKLDTCGLELLSELLAIAPNDYWLNIIKNK